MRSFQLLTLFLIPLLTSAAQSGTPPDSLAWRKRVLGVYDPATGEPVEGARVIELKNGSSSFTTKTGTVTLAFLPVGASTVRVLKLGYQGKTVEITIAPDDTSPVTVELEKSTNVLPTVTTHDTNRYFSPGLQGFMARSKLHQGGQFITEDELRKHETQSITSMVRRLSGVTVQCPRTGTRRGECWATSNHLTRSRGQSSCPVAVYIDGASSFDNDLEKLVVSNFAGVEFHTAASVPPQYNKTNNICGVLLLWTRER